MIGANGTALRRTSPASRPLHVIEHDSQLEPTLKICVLAACPFPANHGTPGSIRELVEATAERGHEVHVVSYHMGEDMPLRSAHLHRIPNLTGERGVKVGPTRYRPLYDFQMIFSTLKVVWKHRPDLIHAHGYEAALVAACCKPFARLPILYSAHNRMGDELASYDFFRSKRLANSFAWVLDHTVPHIGDRCIPHSVNLQQFLLARGLASRSEPVLNFGIDVDRCHSTFNPQELRHQLGLGNDPLVLYSGVMDRFQRLDLLLGAMVQVLRRVPRAKLMLLANVPNAKHERAILEEVKRLGIQGSFILKVPSNMEKGLRLLSICDVAVVPRPCAPGFPIKLLNYMMAHKPCVMFASSASGVSHGEHVWLAGEDTSESLAVAITRLLKNPELRSRIAAGGNRFVREHHDRRFVAAQLCRAYIRLLEKTDRLSKVANRPHVQPARLSADFEDEAQQQSSKRLEVEIHASA